MGKKVKVINFFTRLLYSLDIINVKEIFSKTNKRKRVFIKNFGVYISLAFIKTISFSGFNIFKSRRSKLYHIKMNIIIQKDII